MRNVGNVTKKVAAAVLCGIMVLGAVACQSASESMQVTKDADFSMNGAWSGSTSMNVISEEMKMDVEYGMTSGTKPVAPSASANDSSMETPVSTTTRKVIKTANLNLQTLDFQEFQAALESKILEASAYLQYADVYGTDYSGRKSGNYTVRVPEANLNFFLSGLEGIATVVNKTLGEEDVTLDYVDTESHIRTLEIEQERLLALLEKADDLESIIKLEQRLSEVRYNIEYYESRLRNYDDKITYSTVRIYVYEVARVQEKEPETIWERMSTGWADTIYDISSGAQDFLVWVVINLPYLAFWGIVLVVLVVIFKKKRAKRRAKKSEKQSGNNETELDSKE